MLALSAHAVIRRYRPKVVMVTGSVGKTSTKDAVAAVLSARFLVRASEKSFNSEFGVPFTIFGVKNPWNDPLLWFALVKRVVALLVLPNHYPNLLVLEVGADRPGDLAKILKIATPDVVVVTRLPEIPVHVEAYASPEAVREEEFSPATMLPAHAPLIVSADDPYALEAAKRVPAMLVTHGAGRDATVQVGQVQFARDEHGVVIGMQAPVTVAQSTYTLTVRGSVGATQMLPAAAALATAVALQIPVEEALAFLAQYEPPAGRGRILAGRSGSYIIDDSYNSSPVAVEQALATLAAFPGATRRIAVLGDMLELGRYSVEEHARVGVLARHAADVVVAVGIRARGFAEGAAAEGKVLLFDTAREAGAALAESVGPGDVLLVKGSQSMRMERVVEALLADSADVTRLVRQEPRWRAKA